MVELLNHSLLPSTNKIFFWYLKQKPAAGAAGFRGGCG